jgi:uncharacterized membrane protein (Fun14 family)
MEPIMATDPNKPPPRKPWQLLSVRIAFAVTLVGAGLWAYALATAPKHDAMSNARNGSSGSKSFTEGDTRSQAPEGERTVDSAAPATFRLGASFLAGFTIAYVMRKFLRWSLLIAAIAVAGIYALRKTGTVELPWEQIKGGVQSGASWLESQAGNAKELLTGYLPSAAAAVVGSVIGFLRG